MKSLRLLLPVMALITVSGCASIVTGQNQALSVETASADGKSVAGASCKLVNDKGQWFVQSPGSVTVQRSYNDLNVTCSRDGEEPGVVIARSLTKAMAFGNILFGGLIGAAVDAGTGAAYDYPSLIQVVFGRSATIGAPAQESEQKK
jgi:uncharacterized protein YceK